MLITSESKYVIVRILSNLTMLIVQNYSIYIELYDQNKIPYYSIIENDKKCNFVDSHRDPNIQSSNTASLWYFLPAFIISHLFH